MSLSNEEEGNKVEKEMEKKRKKNKKKKRKRKEKKMQALLQLQRLGFYNPIERAQFERYLRNNNIIVTEENDTRENMQYEED